MLHLMASGLLEAFGIDTETCAVSVKLIRKGGELEFSVLPSCGAAFDTPIVAYLRKAVLRGMTDGAVYVGTENGGDPRTFALTVDGRSVDVAENQDAAAVAIGHIVHAASASLADGVRMFSQSIDLSTAVANGSAIGLRLAARNDRDDLLVPGVRPVTCHCGGCGKDRLGRLASPEFVGLITPSFTCGNPYFGAFAETLERVAGAILPDIELSQLRRLRIELAEAGSSLTVTLPDGDVGKPCDGTVLHAKSVADLLGQLLGRRGIRVGVLSLDDLDDLAAFSDQEPAEA